MTQLWKKPQQEHRSSAKVVDGSLILTLPDALNPVVWRMELGSVKTSALEVRTQDNGNFALVLKTPKGEMHEIAPFDDKDKAVNALMRVSAAMQSAAGRMSSAVHVTQAGAANAAAPAAAADGSSSWKWIVALMCVAGVIILFSYLGSLTGSRVASAPASSPSSTQGQTGVPESADDVLRGF